MATHRFERRHAIGAFGDDAERPRRQCAAQRHAHDRMVVGHDDSMHVARLPLHADCARSTA